ncbi:ABC transporter permease [Marinilabilia sp.]|uniref:ABC transporter permease n=1 Tax=Marinilabilia sp. TaxID=2021252 RepID=UPI0025B9CDB5|nr:ABC transporter permease [Marinilabilia sp.]
MTKNIRIVFRKVRNDKTLSVLKLAGLVLAFLVTIFLVCNITYHRSFDRFHEGSERIYNVYIDETYRGTKDIYGECPLAVGTFLKDLFPEVENTVRTKNKLDVSISENNKTTFIENVIWTDPSFINVFELDLISGSKTSFLKHSVEVYIAESLSKKIFGDLNSVGKIIKINDRDFTIAGIFKDYPPNSHQKFSALLPLESYVPNYDTYSWESYEFLTYIKFEKGIDQEDFENKAQKIINDYWVPWLKTHYNLDFVFDDENSLELKLIPVSDIHLQGSFVSSFENESNISVIYISLIMVLVLLLIAYFNLMGFAFSKGKKHQFQLNIKRCLGGSKNDITSAFVIENLVYTFFSFLIASVISVFVFNLDLQILLDLSNIALTNYIFPFAALLFIASLIAILFGLILGLYFGRISMKTGVIKSVGYSTFWLNRAMLITQMAASIILLICIAGIYKQLKYISAFDLGIDTENVVVINQAYKIRNHYDAFKNELRKSPLIKEVACSNSYPFNEMNTGSYIPVDSPDDTPYPFPYFLTDIGFQEVFNSKMVEGRWFSEEIASDENAVILNQAAVKKMGFQNPIGKEFYNDLSKTQKVKVIGVVEDFNFRSLHHEIEPLLFSPIKKGDYWRYIEIKGTESNRNILLSEINTAWSKVAENEYMNYSFLDDRVTMLYEKERKAKSSIGLFSLIAVLISCFGLLGTVLNISNEKTKEIGIRKVNGAKIWEVMALLNKDFVKWVAIAFVIATPIAWYAMNKWLQNFAYKTELSWWIFALAGLLALGIALLTVSWQSWRAARRNPVEALRYE